MRGRSFDWIRLLFIAAVCVLAHGCAEAPPSKVDEKPPPTAQAGEPLRAEAETPARAIAEEPPPPPEVLPANGIAALRRMPELPPPTPEEIGGAIERVFKGAVTVETGRSPYFVVGDFNGDFSQDVAVVVRPVPERLSELNDELAGLILVAPVRPVSHQSYNTPAHADTLRRQRVYVDEGDVLLAVLHGYEAQGWRHPQATQTYVLKDAAGEMLERREQKLVLKAGGKERMPRLVGDVIAQKLGGQTGFLYYNGAKYAWFDPLRDQAPAPARLVHGGSMAESARQ